MKLSEYQRSRSFFDLGQRSLRLQSLMFDFWPVYSGERFRAIDPLVFNGNSCRDCVWQFFESNHGKVYLKSSQL